jgi:broad specificity phosphatase PhoE
MNPRPTVFGLIRHAKTEWNAAGRIQGQTDTPLSQAGRHQVDRWSERLEQCRPWQGILCSDLLRARETAQRLNRRFNLPLYQDHRLREQDWGQWTGTRLTSLRKQANQELAHQERLGWGFTPPGGESRLCLLHRVLQALSEAHQAHPGTCLLVVSHQGVIKTLLYHLLGRSFLPTEPRLVKGYQVHLIDCRVDRFRLIATNHLHLS